MILDLIARIFQIFDICPEALTPGVMHLQQDLSFLLKIKKKPLPVVQSIIQKDESVSACPTSLSLCGCGS